jgi:hypothetical protein
VLSTAETGELDGGMDSSLGIVRNFVCSGFSVFESAGITSVGRSLQGVPVSILLISLNRSDFGIGGS